MKWLRAPLLIFALMSPLAPANCRANMLEDDPPGPPPSSDPEGDLTIATSVVGSTVAMALGASFIALRAIRKQNAQQPK
jgi:hypothetical protein